MNTEQNAVVVNALTKTFSGFFTSRKVCALQDVSLKIPRGSLFALLGANGAGKSTFLKILLGHLFPTSGSVRVLNALPGTRHMKSRIGYLPEQTAFWSTDTAGEALRFFGRLHNLDEKQIETRSASLLSLTGIAHAADRPCGAFSHGMKRRLGLCCALINDPDLLILDEPTAGMDPLGCREVKDLLLSLHQHGKTIIITGHLLADIQDICNRVALFHAGKLHAVGTLQDLLRDETELVLRMKTPVAGQGAQLKTQLEPIVKDVEHSFSAGKQSLESYFISQVRALSEKEKSSGARPGTDAQTFLDTLAQKPKPLDVQVETPVDENLLQTLAHASAKQDVTEPDTDAIDALTRTEK